MGKKNTSKERGFPGKRIDLQKWSLKKNYSGNIHLVCGKGKDARHFHGKANRFRVMKLDKHGIGGKFFCKAIRKQLNIGIDYACFGYRNYKTRDLNGSVKIFSHDIQIEEREYGGGASLLIYHEFFNAWEEIPGCPCPPCVDEDKIIDSILNEFSMDITPLPLWSRKWIEKANRFAFIVFDVNFNRWILFWSNLQPNLFEIVNDI